MIDSARKDLIADALCFGHGFAGHRRLVDGAFAGDDLAVCRYTVAGANHDDVTDRQLVCRDFMSMAVMLAQRRARHEVGKGADRSASPARGKAFEQFSDQKEHDDNRRFGTGSDDDGSDSGDGHQRFDGERQPQARRGNRAAGNGDQPHEHSRYEAPGVESGNKLFSGKGEGECNRAGQRQPRLTGLPPRLAVWQMAVSCGAFRLRGSGPDAVSHALGALPELGEIGIRHMLERYRASRYRYRGIDDAARLARSRLDLGSAVGAIHALNGEAGGGQLLCHLLLR